MEVDSSTDTAVENAIGWNIPKIEESNSGNVVAETGVKRFLTILDQLDTSVERLRREARDLQDKRDSLLMSMDLIRNNENFSDLNEYEREELNCYLGRISTRLATVVLNVTTIRDKAQEESLHQVNSLIDTVITTTDRIAARLHCQHYLNCCSDGGTDGERITDKKFEMALLGCALDDQKNIKKRLQALMTYLNKQIIAVE
ncbi:BAG family molecular chaperone regulator 2 [Bradysia coprophila]|uniref:BAG family molecular chaperone regulator 2 n=1 Tax=Bradysia coprophila TaxID=38358 RepID=UPI00187DCB29|nr:BAG family molecular chaperone regulator 2 [Bradysia coprophila]